MEEMEWMRAEVTSPPFQTTKADQSMAIKSRKRGAKPLNSSRLLWAGYADESFGFGFAFGLFLFLFLFLFCIGMGGGTVRFETVTTTLSPPELS